MPATIVPVAKSLYLCDYHFGYEKGKADLYGVFNAIRPKEYPHTQERFSLFAQLVGGRGKLPFFVDVVHAPSEQLVHMTATNTLWFPSRTIVVQLALTIEGCRFEQPGVYLLELYCDNTCVADVPLVLR